jgi:hypothetical protein
MKVKLGVGVAAMSGKAGGTIASRNKGGAYFKQWVNPTNPNSSRQQEVRSSFAEFSTKWSNTLTQAQRDGWATFADQNPITDRFGDVLKMTGQNAYVRLNQRLRDAGLAELSAAPADQDVTDLTSVTATVDNGLGGWSLDFLPTPLGADDYLIIKATPPVNAGVSYVKNLFRQIGVSAAAAASPLDLQTEYEAVFGAVPVGKKVVFQVFVIRSTNGAYDAALEASAIAVST